MRTKITSHNWFDRDGHPAGGSCYGNGFAISWQNGPLGRDKERRDPNGAFVEDVIAAALQRIEWYQNATEFACEENADAIKALRTALERLDDRTKVREKRGVEGTHAQ